MKKKLYLMQETELKAFLTESKGLVEAAKAMTAEEVKAHSDDILLNTQINEIVEGENLKLEIGSEGVAHIPIVGMLTNTVTPSAGFFGESITTFEFISESVKAADENPKVNSITFEIASGGGDVDGVEAAANAIFTAKKPTKSRVHAMAASAAFWLASQTGEIVAVGRTSSFGSIGVAAEFIDRSDQDKSNGIKRVVLTSTDAPQKRLDIKTAEGQKNTINRLDEIHNVFVDHIVRGISTRHPKVNADFVNKNFGRGSVMGADSALANLMIDSIEGITNQEINNTGGAIAASSDSPPEKPVIKPRGKKMNLAEFLKENPSAQSEIDQLVAAGKEEGRTELKAELKAASEKVKPIISSESYRPRIKTAGYEVVTGERTLQSFMDMVAVVDEDNEAGKSEGVKTSQPKPTPGEPGAGEKELAAGQTKANAEALGKSLNTTSGVQ